MNTFLIFESKKLLQLFDGYNEKHQKKLVYRVEMWIVLYEIIQFFPYATKKNYHNYDGQIYHYIDRDKMLTDIVVVRVSRNTLADIIKALVTLDLIREKQIKDKEFGTYCFYAFGGNLPDVLAEFSDYCSKTKKWVGENLATDRYTEAAKALENFPTPTDEDAPPAYMSDNAYIRDFMGQQEDVSDADIPMWENPENPGDNDAVPLPEAPPLPDMEFSFVE